MARCNHPCRKLSSGSPSKAAINFLRHNFTRRVLSFSCSSMLWNATHSSRRFGQPCLTNAWSPNWLSWQAPASMSPANGTTFCFDGALEQSARISAARPRRSSRLRSVPEVLGAFSVSFPRLTNASRGSSFHVSQCSPTDYSFSMVVSQILRLHWPRLFFASCFWRSGAGIGLRRCALSANFFLRIHRLPVVRRTQSFTSRCGEPFRNTGA